MWDAKIKKQIRECALFLPLVSAHTEERSEGYFRREWLLAVERTRDMAAGRTFIVPVVIDDTPEAGTAVPEEFMRYQWTRLASGEPTPDFVAQVKKLLKVPKKPALKPDLPRPPTLPPDFKLAAQAKAAAGAVAGSGDSVRQKMPVFPGWMWSSLHRKILVQQSPLRVPAPIGRVMVASFDDFSKLKTDSPAEAAFDAELLIQIVGDFLHPPSPIRQAQGFHPSLKLRRTRWRDK